MRQAGVLAAAGLVALEDGPARLCDDHANARLLAEAVAKHEVADIDLGTVETNIVIFKLKAGRDAAAFCTALKERGVLASAVAARAVRFVTHLDVSKEECAKASSVAETLLTGWA